MIKLIRKLTHYSSLTIALISPLSASIYQTSTYEALGGDASNDNLSQATQVLSEAISISKTGDYRAVVQCGAGSATWIGNSNSKSYFITVAHVANAASNTITTHDGTTIAPASGSTFHTAFNDFGLLEYNGLLDPSLFGGQRAVLMDLNIVDSFLGEETTIVGYGNLTIGSRTLGRTRALSTAFITLENNERTRSDISTTYNPDQPFAGTLSPGDSGGGVFLNLQGRSVLIGAGSSGNSTLYNYAHVFAHKDLIDSVVPEGVFDWYSEYEPTFVPDPNKTYYIENPTHGYRIAATGESEDPYTVSITSTSEDARWKFTQNLNGLWHIDRAAGGSKPRLRTDNTSNPDMQATSSSGGWTRYEFTPSTTVSDAYYLTLRDGPSNYQRLRVLSDGSIDYSSTSNQGIHPSLRIVEASDTSIVHITKRNATSFAIDSGGTASNGKAVYIWNANQNNGNQQWEEINRGGGYYSYQKAGSNFSLDGQNGGGNNQNVFLWGTNETNYNQQWQKVSTGGGAYKLIKRNASGYAINGGSGGTNGQNVNLYDSSNSSYNLQWFVTEL